MRVSKHVVTLCMIFISALFQTACVTLTPEQEFMHQLNYSGKSDQEAIAMINGKYGSYDRITKESGLKGNIIICERYYRGGHFSTARHCYEDLVAEQESPMSYEEYEKVINEMGVVASALAKQSPEGWYGNAKQRAASGLMSLAEISLHTGDYESVVQQADKARQRLKSSQFKSDTKVNWTVGTVRIAQGYSAAAIASMQLGNLNKAREYAALCERMEFMTEMGFPVETTGDDKRRNSACASAAFAIGDIDTADRLINQSVGGMAWRIIGAIATFGTLEAMGEASQMTDPWDRTAVFLKGRICQLRGNLQCAAQAYDSLLTDSQKNIHMSSIDTAMLADRPNLFYQVLYHRAIIALQQGEMDRALALLKQSVDVIETLRSNIDTETAKIGFVGDKQVVYARLVEQLIAAGRMDEAFAYVERGKARALVDLLASKKQIQAGAQTEEINNLLSAVDKVDAGLLASANSEQTGQRSAERALIKSRLDKLKTTQPELVSLVTVSAPQLAELQKRLTADDTLLEYYGHDDQLYVFVLTRKGVGAIKLNGKGLQDSVNRFRAALSNPGAMSYRNEARSLYARLIAPVEKQLGTKNITIVPHAALHYLPFAALYNGQEYLIDRYALRILPSASVMEFLGKAHQPKGSLLALGNPDLKNTKLDLPGAQVEATAIAKAQPGAKLLLRQQATETSVKQYGGQFRYLHFASHGMFDPDKPLDSGLLLAADHQNDGTLTVGELYDLNLSADLVTLSACETALGKIANGDDVVGFTRGFLYAGANSIVSSLWKVDDKATSELMQSFYQAMSKNNKGEALRMAQLQLKQKQSHPYYWAAFQLTGSVN